MLKKKGIHYMVYEDRIRTSEGLQNVVIENREKLSLTGALGVVSFDEFSVIADTTQGTIAIRGEELHLEKLNLDIGEIKIRGRIDSIEYESDEPKEGGGLFSRLFR